MGLEACSKPVAIKRIFFRYRHMLQECLQEEHIDSSHLAALSEKDMPAYALGCHRLIGPEPARNCRYCKL